jgi:predicted CoA-binding protein
VTRLGGIATHKNPDDKEIKRLLEVSRNVAVVGLSEKQYRTSYQIARTLQRFGYKVFPVNPNLTGPVLGEEPYATVEEIPKRIDIVDVFRRSEKVMAVAKDAVTAGARVLWLQSGVINEEAARYAEDHGLIVIMDRCIKVEQVSLVGQ